jgi:competence protein ComEC
VATAGWKHHFGHPKPDVLERWRRAGTRILETAADGALTLVVNPVEGYYLAGHRQSGRRFWQRRKRVK